MDPFARLKEDGGEYNVYDSHYEKVGKVDDLLMDEEDRVVYVGVKMGFLGTNSTLIPAEIIRINDKRRLIEVSEPAESIRHAPHFSSSEELTPELENHVRTYFGLGSLQPSPEHDPQGPDISEDLLDRFGTDDRVDTVPGERADTEDRPAPVQDSTGDDPREGTPERTSSEEPISERLSHEPSLQERLTTGGGVTVHRLRR